MISWDINTDREIENNPNKTSEVEVLFLPEAPDRTRVELIHRYLERQGDSCR